MQHEKRTISLGFDTEKVQEGQHICYLYNDDRERLRVMSKYLESGLLANEKVLYMVDSMTPEEMLATLGELGIDIRSREDDCAVRSAESGYCKDGCFTSSEMLDVIKAFYQEAMQQGYSGARGTGEMSWCLVEGRAEMSELMTYEARLNDLLSLYPYTACCQYDTRKFDGSTIMDVLSVHPVMIVRGQLVKNPFYVKPAEFIAAYNSR